MSNYCLSHDWTWPECVPLVPRQCPLIAWGYSRWQRASCLVLLTWQCRREWLQTHLIRVHDEIKVTAAHAELGWGDEMAGYLSAFVPSGGREDKDTLRWTGGKLHILVSVQLWVLNVLFHNLCDQLRLLLSQYPHTIKIITFSSIPHKSMTTFSQFGRQIGSCSLMKCPLQKCIYYCYYLKNFPNPQVNHTFKNNVSDGVHRRGGGAWVSLCLPMDVPMPTL